MTLFFFSGFIALGVFLSQLLFCRGAVCSSAQASTVFSAFLFVLWGCTLMLECKKVLKAGFLRRQAATTKMNGGLPPMSKEADMV